MEQMIRKAYDEIAAKEKANTIAQGLSGVLGFPFTLGVDAGVIPTIYMPMFNNIRSIFGRTTNQSNVLTPLITNIVSEILFDLVVDKFLGNIAIVGIYFNAICAKTMTWRLGILFSMLAARGETIDPEKVADAVKLIRLTFPQGGAFSFKRPDYNKFRELVSQFYNVSPSAFDERIKSRIASLSIPNM